MREPLTALEDRFLRFEAKIEGRPGIGPGRIDLLHSKDAVSYTHLTLPTNREV